MSIKKQISLLTLLVSLLVVGCQKQTIVPDNELFDSNNTSSLTDKSALAAPTVDEIGYINDDDCDCPDEDDEGEGSGKRLTVHDQHK